jgi:hypothetical protein
MQLSSTFGASLIVRAFSVAFAPQIAAQMRGVDWEGEKIPGPADDSSVRCSKFESMARRQVPLRKCRYSRCG